MNVEDMSVESLEEYLKDLKGEKVLPHSAFSKGTRLNFFIKEVGDDVVITCPNGMDDFNNERFMKWFNDTFERKNKNGHRRYEY